jgi:hypothetical protein
LLSRLTVESLGERGAREMVASVEAGCWLAGVSEARASEVHALQSSATESAGRGVEHRMQDLLIDMIGQDASHGYERE